MPQQLPLAAVAAANLRNAGEGRIASAKHAADAVVDLWCLARTMHDVGHFPTWAEFGKAYNISERTVARKMKQLGVAFPGTDTQRLTEWMLARTTKRLDDSSAALTVVAPPDLQPA